jgi:hypothetical protein
MRFFWSPPLVPGKTYYYDLEVTYLKEGKEVTRKEAATIKAGEETTVDLRETSLRKRPAKVDEEPATHPREKVAKPIRPTFSFDIEEKGVNAGGLAFDGKNLWVSAQSVSVPDLLLKYSLKGELVKRFAFPGAGNLSGGLTHDGKELYVLDYKTNLTGGGAIFRLEGEQLRKIVDLPREQNNTFGLTHMDGALFYAHSPTVRPGATIYKIGADFKVSKVAEVRFYVIGLASDGKSILCSTMKEIHRLDKDYQLLETYLPSVPLADITWANGALWGVEHNKNRVHRFTLNFKQDKAQR